MTTPEALPKLPAPVYAVYVRTGLVDPGDYFTADQMRDYARAALAGQAPAQPDEHPYHCAPQDIAALLRWLDGINDPQQEPMPSLQDTDWRGRAGVIAKVIRHLQRAGLDADNASLRSDGKESPRPVGAMPVARLPHELMESHCANALEATMNGFRGSVLASMFTPTIERLMERCYRMGFMAGWRIHEKEAAGSSTDSASTSDGVPGTCEPESKGGA